MQIQWRKLFMNIELIKSLILNASLLLGVSIIYNSIERKNQFHNIYQILHGIFAGIIGIIVIINAVNVSPGVVFDTRSILVSITGMFLGIIPAFLSALIISIYRIIVGGDGVYMGVAVTCFSALIGVWWHLKRFSLAKNNKKTWFEFYLVGVLVHIVMLLCTVLLPNNVGRKILKEIAFPVLLIYPIVTFLLCLITFSKKLSLKIKFEAEKNELYFKSIFEQAPIGIAIVKDNDILYINTSFEKFIGRTVEQCRHIGWSNILNSTVTESDSEINKNLEYKNIDKYCVERRFIRPDGTLVWGEVTVSNIYEKNLIENSTIYMVQDISSRKEKEAEIQHLIYHDILTGVFNRNYFEEKCVKLNSEFQLPLAVISADIDGLKLMNDAFGHEAGDKLLVEAADIFKNCCNEQDVVARTGGDEFYILLPNTGEKEAREVMQKIKHEVKRKNKELENSSLFLSVSLGFSVKKSEKEDFQKILNIADDYMYQRKLLEQNSLHSSIISSIRATMFEKSNETEEHGKRMAKLAVKLGKQIGLEEEELNSLELLAQLHDIGKINIDIKILAKKDKLTDEEWKEMKKHPEIGYRIASNLLEIRHVAEYILYHHERWDGTGYPKGLQGNDIPLLSRIISIVDAFDAMTNQRSYKEAFSIEKAIEEIKVNSGTQFDPALVERFISLF